MAVAPADIDTEDADRPEVVGVPCRAEGVELLGELAGSGFKETPFLARRGDGQTIQLTELLFHVLEEIDGERDFDAVADAVSDRIDKRAAPEDIAFLVEEKLRPLGLLCDADGAQPKIEKPNPLLALRFRLVVSNPKVTKRLTAPFAALFWPPIVLAVVAGFCAMTGWLLFGHGLAGGTRQLMYQPSLLVLLFVLTALSAGFHEFGHAAACRYGGATPGVMGAGLYLVWPAFYTDVTDSYRLSKGGRLRTDLGGLYFNMVFALATFGVWALSGWDALLLVVPLQLLQMTHQLLPFVRLDGYLILSDITGVPDLFSRIKPTLLGLIPWRETDSRTTALKPWVRVVVSIWVLAVIPVLLFGLTMMVMGLPRVAATAWDSASRQLELVGAGGWTSASAVISLAALLLPVVSSIYMLGRVIVRLAKNPRGRFLLVPGLAVLVWLWWPHGEYQPIRADERGTVQDSVRAIAAASTGRPAYTTSTTTSTSTTSTTAPPEETSTTVATDDEPAATTSTTAGRSTTTTTEAPTTTTTEAPTTTTTAPTTTTTETTTP